MLYVQINEDKSDVKCHFSWQLKCKNVYNSNDSNNYRTQQLQQALEFFCYISFRNIYSNIDIYFTSDNLIKFHKINNVKIA